MSAHARQRSSWLSVVAAVAGTAALSLFSVGCPEPADLDNPEMYPKRGGGTGVSGSATGGSATGGSATGGGGSATGGGGNLAACETTCMTTVLEGCVACHGAGALLGQLDLAMPGYTARLKDQASKHAEVGGGQCPTGDKLIDSAMPDESWLLKKVASQQGSCGSAMPLGTGLMGADLQCVRDYVTCVAMGGM